MNTQSGLKKLLIPAGLLIAIYAGYVLASRLFITKPPDTRYEVFGFPSLPPLTELDVPAQTVNGVTATIEGAYADPSRVIFIIRLSSELGTYPTHETFITNANGEQVGVYSYQLGPIPEEPLKYLMVFTPVDWLKESQLDGQLSVGFRSLTDSNQIISFLFDIQLPIHPFITFNPKQTVSVNGVDIFLDRVVVAPADTYFYLCYPNRSDENWILTGENITLSINKQVSNPNMPSPWIYDSTIIEGEQEQFAEPGWSPPSGKVRCIKLGFPVGDPTPTSLILTLPGLEDAMTTVVPDDRLSMAHDKLLGQGIDMKWSANPEHGITIEYNKLPDGMSEKEAYHHFMDALGYIHEGPWVFNVKLKH